MSAAPSSPTCRTQMPSRPGSWIIERVPVSSECRSTSADAGSTPITRVPGAIDLTAAATPARSEPPKSKKLEAASKDEVESLSTPAHAAATLASLDVSALAGVAGSLPIRDSYLAYFRPCR